MYIGLDAGRPTGRGATHWTRGDPLDAGRPTGRGATHSLEDCARKVFQAHSPPSEPANKGAPGPPGPLGAGDGEGAEREGAAGEGAVGEVKGEFVYSGNHLVVAAAMAEVAAGARFQRY
jgi:hypothetical protein